MFKKIFIYIILLFSFPLFAKSSDFAIIVRDVSQKIISSVKENTIIAILDFSSEEAAIGTYINDSITSDVIENGNLRLVTRNHIDLIRKELNYQYSGYVNDETAISLCEQLGAQALVFGEFSRFGKDYRLTVKMIDVETGSYILFKSYIIKKANDITGLLLKEKRNKAKKVEKKQSNKIQYYKDEEIRENRVSIGCTAEANMYSVNGIAMAAGIILDYNVSDQFGIGIKTNFSYDVFTSNSIIYTIEPFGFVRYYPVFSEFRNSSFFVEVQAGCSVVNFDNSIKTTFMSAGEIGFRLKLGNMYFEPYIRGGYPLIIACGLSCGIAF